MTNYFEKEGQKRSVTKMLGRGLNPINTIKYLGSEEYRDLYDAVAEVDNDMRDQINSQKSDIREFLHNARMGMKNREYAKVIYYTMKLLSIVDGVFDKVKDIEVVRDRVIKEFNRPGISEEEEKELHERFKNTREASSYNIPKKLLYAVAAPNPELVSEATAMQWIRENIPNYRQMTGNMLERFFKNKLAKEHEAARHALRIAEHTYSSIKDIFDKLDSARTDFGQYIKIAKDAKKKFSKYNQDLSNIYKTYFKDVQPENIPENVPEVPPSNIPPSDVPLQEGVVQIPEQEQATEPSIELETDEEKKLNEDTPLEAAVAVTKLIERAKLSAKNGDYGLSAAILTKASGICDRYNNENYSIYLLKAAERILKK